MPPTTQEENDLITYVVPCQSCNAFLSLTTATDLDQICQACRTPVTPLVKLLKAGKVEELPLPQASQQTFVTATCPGDECGRTAMFPKNFAIYCPVCLKHVMKEDRPPPPMSCWQRYTGRHGEKLATACDNCLTYVSEKPNPIFQIIYLCIMCGWFYLYIRFGWLEESNSVLPVLESVPGGLLHMRIIEVGFVTGIFLLLQTYRADPGIVTVENHAQLMELYPKPESWEQPLKWCNSCRHLRPPRSHHCRVCEICVMRFDHHCVWLNTCIAAKNLRWFLAFVGFHALLCAYGAVFSGVLIYFIAHQVAAGDTSVISWLGERRLHNYQRFLPQIWGRAVTMIGNVGDSQISWTVVYAANVPLMALLIFCAVMATVLGSFFMVHVLQVMRNQTSYEGWTYRPPPAVDEDLQDESQSTGDKKVAMEKAPSASGTRIRQRSVSKGSTTEIDHSDAAESHASDDKSDDDSDDNGASCRPRLTNPSPNVLPWKFNQGTSWKNASEVLFPDTFWAQQKQRQ